MGNLKELIAERDRLREALERIRTLNHGKFWKLPASDVIDGMVVIAVMALQSTNE